MTVFKKHVFVCTQGKTCAAQGAENVFNELRAQALKCQIGGDVRINKAGCMFQCGNGPMVVVYPESIWYANVAPGDCQEIIESHIQQDEPVERLFYDTSKPRRVLE